MYKIDLHIAVKRLLHAIDDGIYDGLQLASQVVVVEAKKRAPQRTSNLVRSIQAGDVEGSLASGYEVTISAAAPYAAFIEFGTKGPYRVEPRRRLALRWANPAGGGWLFSKGHNVPGMKARPFLQPAVDENADRLANIVAQAINNQVDQAF